MAIRFDAGTIRKAEYTPEGYFRAETVFARDGILEYRTPDGNVRRELRTPETNKKALVGFGLKPVSLEHPPVLIDSLNAKEYSVGLSDSTVVYDPGGFVRGVITVLDSIAVDSIRNGKTLQISAGYKCNIDPTPGVWKGQRYDAIQTDLEINHIALTQKGRAGEEVKICFDDDKDDDIAFEGVFAKNKKNTSIERNQNMARVTIDSVTYDEIPETFASVAGQKISELEKSLNRIDSLEAKEQSLNSKISEFEKEIKELEEERDRSLGRADGYEEIVNAAIPVLEEHGYSWNADAAEFVTDSKNKNPKKSFVETEEEEEEEDPEEEADETDEEEMAENSKPWNKKKAKKKDSVSERLDAWKKAEFLGFEDRFDSDLDTHDIRLMALKELMPDTDISGYSPAWVEGLFDAVYLESQQDDEDEQPRHDSVLQDIVRVARTPARSASIVAQDERTQALANAWQAPLSLSR